MKHLKVIDDFGPVGSGVSNAHYVAAENGNEYLIKGPDLAPGEVYAAVNEIICANLGQKLGLPLLDPCIVEMNGKLYFASSWMGTGSFYPSATEDLFKKCSNQERVYDMAVFDCWVYNTDRHSGNVVIRKKKTRNSAEVHLLLLNDHSRCLMQPNQKPQDLLAVLDSPLDTHLRIPFLQNAITHLVPLRAALQLVDSLTDSDVTEVVAGVPEVLLPSPDRQPIVDFLIERRKRLRGIFESGRHCIPNLEKGTI